VSRPGQSQDNDGSVITLYTQLVVPFAAIWSEAGQVTNRMVCFVPMVAPTRTGTREKLLDAAEAIVSRQGFAATSIDQILGEVGVTKGSFFYHFKSKNELARALIERFAAADQELLRSNMERAEKLADEPLQQLLIFAGLLVEVAEQLDTSPQPGCLFATYCYEKGLFDEQTHRVIADAFLGWRRVLGEKLRAAAAEHPLAQDVDIDSLADMATVLFEGAFVMARTLSGRSLFADQMRHYRRYLQLLFGARAPAEPGASG
jgi:TetR/AcrR family transcriptional repressor of nem operon